MRKLFYGIILIAVFCVPVQRVEVAKLLPVRAISLYSDDGFLVIETDSGYRGRGPDIQRAIEDLCNNTPYIVYLDTAQYLFATENVTEHLPQFRSVLKGSVRVCVGETPEDLSFAAQYLDVHPQVTKLRTWWTK
jgi:hypothetical protein